MSDIPQPGRTSLTVDEEIEARLRALDLLATEIGDEPLLDYYERIADRQQVKDQLEFMLNVDRFGGYVFLGLREGAPTLMYEGRNAAGPRAKITLSPFDEDLGAGDESLGTDQDLVETVELMRTAFQRTRPRSESAPVFQLIQGGK